MAPRHGLLVEMEMKYEAFCRTACKWAAWCSCNFNVFGGELSLSLSLSIYIYIYNIYISGVYQVHLAACRS